uniref:Insulin-like growth factor binding protein-related protein 6 short n=1 Tax=Amblyomma americanum TaxID=6943 RepID=D5LHI6_AMBAM|nr:insulin-like growth factor binding protein-related protein 6 short [Amblyomma americanum]
MKIALAFFLLAAAAVCVYATSEPHCEGVTCDPETCPKHECHCGSHKDACGCCDFCNKCANEECHPEHNDKCAEGHHCVVKPAGDDHGHATGHCEPVESSTGHDGTHGHDGAHGHNETHGHDGAHGHDETHGHAATPDSETPAQDGGDSAHHE